MMIAYKEFQYAPAPSRGQKMQQATGNGYAPIDEDTLARKCDCFEESLGLLLLRGFMHLETLQLTDIPLLLEHVATVLF